MEASDPKSLSGEDAERKAKPVTIHIAYTVTLGLRCGLLPSIGALMG